MTDPHKILTELVKDVAGSDRSKVQNDPVLTGLDRIAINTAADQINQQQRERVEKLRLYTTHLDGCEYWNTKKCNCGLGTALKELGAEGE